MAFPIIPVLALSALGLLALAGGGKKTAGAAFDYDAFRDPGLPDAIWELQKAQLEQTADPNTLLGYAGIYLQAGSQAPALGAITKGRMIAKNEAYDVAVKAAVNDYLNFAANYVEPAVLSGDTELASLARKALGGSIYHPQQLNDIALQLAKSGYYKAAKALFAKIQLVNFAAGKLKLDTTASVLFATAIQQAQAVVERLAATGAGPSPTATPDQAVATILQNLAAKLDPDMPPEARDAILKLLATEKNPEQLRQAYREAVGQGWGRAAQLLLEKALVMEGKSAVEARQISGTEVAKLLGATTNPAPGVIPVSPTNPGVAVPGAVPSAGPPQLPAALVDLVAKAKATNTRAALTHAATVLEQAGFPSQAAELRAAAAQIPVTPAPTPQVQAILAIEPTMPQDLAAKVATLLANEKNPDKLEAVARELRGKGFLNAAGVVEAAAVKLRAAHTIATAAQTIETIIKPPSPAPIPLPPAPPAPLPPAGSEAELAHQLARAMLTSGENRALTKAYQARTGTLKADGLYGPNTAIDMAEHVWNIPAPLHWSSTKAKKQQVDDYRNTLNATAQQFANAKQYSRAAMLRMSAARAMSGLPAATPQTTSTPQGPIVIPVALYANHITTQPPAAGPPPPAPVVAPAIVSPGLPTAPAPTTPTPQTNPLLASAETMARHLLAKPKKGTESQVLVADFQGRAGLKADGKYGPGTAKRLAEVVANVPIVLYWPAGSTSATVTAYRAALEQLAAAAEAKKNYQRAALLRMSAARERGQGGIAGFVAPIAPKPTPTPNGPITYAVDAIIDQLGATP
jgi:hypothetical protein